MRRCHSSLQHLNTWYMFPISGAAFLLTFLLSASAHLVASSWLAAAAHCHARPAGAHRACSAQPQLVCSSLEHARAPPAKSRAPGARRPHGSSAQGVTTRPSSVHGTHPWRHMQLRKVPKRCSCSSELGCSRCLEPRHIPLAPFFCVH